MKLYYLKTRNFGAYVLGTSVDDAIGKFDKWMQDEDYDFFSNRVVIETRLIADDSARYPYDGITNKIEKLFL